MGTYCGMRRAKRNTKIEFPETSSRTRFPSSAFFFLKNNKFFSWPTFFKILFWRHNWLVVYIGMNEKCGMRSARRIDERKRICRVDEKDLLHYFKCSMLFLPRRGRHGYCLDNWSHHGLNPTSIQCIEGIFFEIISSYMCQNERLLILSTVVVDCRDLNFFLWSKLRGLTKSQQP